MCCRSARRCVSTARLAACIALCVALCAALLCACADGGAGGGAAAPRVSSTPPPVEGTVPVGATAVRPDGRSMSGMSMSGTSMSGMAMSGTSMSGTAMSGMAMPAAPGAGTPSTVPNGTGSYAVPAPNVDGCNHAYGAVSQCIPLRAPGGGPVTCTVLRDHHYLPLLVTRDPLHLLSDGRATVRVTGGRTYVTGCRA